MKKIIIILSICALFIGIYFFYREYSYSQALLTTTGKAGVIREIQINKGSSLRTIAQKLLTEGLITDNTAFERYAISEHMDTQLASGVFSFEGEVSIPKVLNILTGKESSRRMMVRIKEGETLRDIKNTLVEKGLTTENEFAECIKKFCNMKDQFDFLKKASSLEGYIFPDTYYIENAHFSLESFIKQTLQNFNKKAWKSLLSTANGKRTPEELLIMASIIEKESRPRDNQAIVSGILWKRLDNDVQLAVDATNRYIKKDPLAPLTMKELTSSSPYNTRRTKGLPPTAISNPGSTSIEAALQPQESDYWYYLHDQNGQIHYSKTENEHNKMKSLYIE